MSKEDDILKTLQNIERILGNSSRSMGGSTSSGSTSRYDASAARAEEASQQQTRKIYVSTGKAVFRLGAEAGKSADNLKELSSKSGLAGTGLGTFSTAVGKSITQLSTHSTALSKIDLSTSLTALQDAVIAAATSIQTQTTTKGTRASFGKTVGNLDSLIDNQVNPRLGSFSSALHLASQSLIDLWGDLREERRDGARDMKEFGQGISIASSALSRKKGIASYFDTFITQLRKASAGLRDLRTAAKGGGGGGGGGSNKAPSDDEDLSPDSPKNKSLNGKAFGVVKTFLTGFALEASRQVITNAVAVIDQAFQTTGARGFGVFGESFITLSKNAISAGMSLQEYAQMMDANEGLVSRFSSFEEFDKQLNVSSKALAGFGIFGPEAKNLQVAMASSASSLGVPIDDLAKSSKGQLGVFEELRKTTGITADQFAELNRTLQQNEVVQRELIGLDPAERAGRLTQLTQTAAWGKQLGLTTQDAQALQNALINQRKSTVKERFNQRGRLTQSLSLVGMDPSTIAEAAALAGKRMKTPEEEKRFTDILGEYQQRSESIKQSGNEGMANAVETSDQNLESSGLSEQLKAAIAVRAAKQSGAQVQKDFGKTVGDGNQILGNIFTYLQGLGKSPLWGLGVAAVSAAFAAAQVIGTTAIVTATTTGAASIVAAIESSMKFGGKGGASGDDGFHGPMPEGSEGSGGKAKGKWAGRASRAGGAIKGFAKGPGGILAAVGGIAIAANGLSTAAEDAKPENGGDGDVGKKKGEAIGEGIGSAVGAVILGGLGSLGGPLGTYIGSAVGLELGGWAGKLIGGLVGSENATEKNAKELDKLRKEMVETRRAGATPTVIGVENLGMLGQMTQQTGQAYAQNTAAKDQQAQDAINKKNGTLQVADGSTVKAVPILDGDGKVIGYTQSTADKIPLPANSAAAAITPIAIRNKDGEVVGYTQAQSKDKQTVEAVDSAATSVSVPIMNGSGKIVGYTKPGADVTANVDTKSVSVTPTAATSSVASVAPTPFLATSIATPAQTTQTGVNQEAINTAATTAATSAVASTQTTSKTVSSVLEPTNTDQASTLMEILKVLQQSLMAENSQAESISQLIRSPAFSSRLPDNLALMNQARYTA